MVETEEGSWMAHVKNCKRTKKKPLRIFEGSGGSNFKKIERIWADRTGNELEETCGNY